MLNEIGFIVQARTTSKRFPNKVLTPFYMEKTILEIIIEKLFNNFKEYPIILATTINYSDDPIVLLAKKMNILHFRGDEDNVLKRFIDVAVQFGLKYVIRVCADNPFIDIDSMAKLIKKSKLSEYDYVSYKVNSKPALKTHYGFWGEFISLAALIKVSKLTQLSLYTEHVTNYIYENPHIFNIHWLDVPTLLANYNLRFTVDTFEDFKLLKEIYKSLIKHQKDITIQDLVNYVVADKHYMELMEVQIMKNIK